MNTIKNDDANEDEYHWIYHWRYTNNNTKMNTIKDTTDIPIMIPRYNTKWREIPLIQMKIKTIDYSKKMTSYQVKMNTKDTNEDSNHW